MTPSGVNMRDSWFVIRRRWQIVLVASVAVVVLSVIFAARQAGQYRATTVVKYAPSTLLSDLRSDLRLYSTTETIETQASVITSSAVLEDVARRLGGLPNTTGAQTTADSKTHVSALGTLRRAITAGRLPTTDLIEIAATAPTPREAQNLATLVTDAYRDYDRGIRSARIAEARKVVESQLTVVNARLNEVEHEAQTPRGADGRTAGAVESRASSVVVSELRTELARTRQRRTELELAQARLTGGKGARAPEGVLRDTKNPALQRLQAAETELQIERNNLALEVTDQHPRLQALDERLREVRAEIRREVAAQIATLRNREEILTRQLSELINTANDVRPITPGIQSLPQDAKINEDLRALAKLRHDEAVIKEAENLEDVTVLRSASEPTAPVGRHRINTLLLSSVLGLFVGLVLAFVREALDTSTSSLEDVESLLHVAVLGVVPHIETRDMVHRLMGRRPALATLETEALESYARLITHFEGPVVEAYRRLRTNLQLTALKRGGKTVMITSAMPGEGKSTTAVNLAVAMAQNGQRTLLVGADLRRPTIEKFFGIEREPGLADVLVGAVQWRDCVRTVADVLVGCLEIDDVLASPGFENLHIIAAGAISGNPSEQLSVAMGDFLRSVRAEYDFVIVDTPSIVPSSDALIIAGQVDGVVLVYQANKVRRPVVERAKARLVAGRAKVWGVVITDAPPELAALGSQESKTSEESGDMLLPQSSGEADIEQNRPAEGHTVRPRDSRGSPYRGPSKRSIVAAAVVLSTLAVVVWRLESGPRIQAKALQRIPGDTSAPAPLAVRPPVAATTADVPSPDNSAFALVPPASTSPTSATEAEPPPASAAMPAAPAAPRPRSAIAERVARYAVELGPFPTTEDAQRVERQMTQAGYQTVRFRQQTGAAVYAVFVERESTRDTAALVATLREQGFTDLTAVTSEDTVRIGDAVPLRAAVQLAERVRSNGHHIHIATQPGQAVMFTVRHGNFASADDARAKSDELARLGLPANVVKVK